jgi:hypothetical protein
MTAVSSGQIDCDVRPARSEEADALEQAMPTGPSMYHRKRLEGQEAGHSTYLVAWSGDQPVGQLYVKWRGADEEVAHRYLGDIP